LDSILRVGLREVIDKGMIEEVFEVLRNPNGEMSSNWNRRYRDHLEKIKSGDILEVCRSGAQSHAPGSGKKDFLQVERKMLENSKQIMVSELLLVQGIDQSEIINALESIFDSYPG